MSIWATCDYLSFEDSPINDYPYEKYKQYIFVQCSCVDERTQLKIANYSGKRRKSECEAHLDPEQVRYLIECLQGALKNNSNIKEDK